MERRGKKKECGMGWWEGYFLFGKGEVWGFSGGSVVKDPPANVGETGDPWVWKIPCRRKWQPTPVFLPGRISQTEKPGRLQSWDCKESDTTEHAHTRKGEVLFPIESPLLHGISRLGDLMPS